MMNSLAISNAMRKAEHVPLDADDLDELDRTILDYLQEGRGEGVPWGIGTPAVVRTALSERGFDEDELPVRQTINNRMKDMALAGHLENRFDKGEYVFRSDPRKDNNG